MLFQFLGLEPNAWLVLIFFRITQTICALIYVSAKIYAFFTYTLLTTIILLVKNKKGKILILSNLF